MWIGRFANAPRISQGALRGLDILVLKDKIYTFVGAKLLKVLIIFIFPFHFASLVSMVFLGNIIEFRENPFYPLPHTTNERSSWITTTMSASIRSKHDCYMEISHGFCLPLNLFSSINFTNLIQTSSFLHSTMVLGNLICI